MKRLLTYKFPIAATLLLLALTLSCSHEPDANEPDKPGSSNVHEWEDSTINGDATMTRMVFSVGDSINVVRQGQTRATTTVAGATTFQANDIVTIGVSGKSTKDYKVTNTTSGALAYNGTATDAYCWQSTSETVSLRAWSYGNTTTNSGDPDNAVYTQPTDQSSNYGELLYAPASNYDYATYKTGIPITLYHQLARLVINLEHIKTGDLNVSEIYIGDGSTATIPTTAKFHKPSTGNIGTWDNIGTEKGKITPKTETANACYSAVLIPGTYAANQKFIVIKTSDSRTYCYIPTSPIVLAAGNQYNYTISVKDLKEVSSLTIADIAAYTYDGTAKEPHPTITDGSKTLTEGTDYTLSWSNNTNAGTATVTVTGKGGYYNGSQSKNFTINPKALTVTAKSQAVHQGTNITQAVEQITYSGNISGHSISSVTLTQSTTSETTNGTITPSGVIIKDDNNNVVTSNYDITYNTGALKIWASLSNSTSAHLGKAICSQGFIHANANDVTCGGTAKAMIGYANGKGHGLAVALNIAGMCGLSEINSIVTTFRSNNTVTGGTWSLPSVANWNDVFHSFGGRDGEVGDIGYLMAWSSGTFISKMNSCGSTTDYASGYVWASNTITYGGVNTRCTYDFFEDRWAYATNTKYGRYVVCFLSW
jgi:hypothetical protein